MTLIGAHLLAEVEGVSLLTINIFRCKHYSEKTSEYVHDDAENMIPTISVNINKF